MKTHRNRYLFLLPVSFMLILFAGCRDFEYSEIIPSSTPVIQNLSFSPSAGVTYGDSITLTASLTDKTPLSTLEVSLIINDEVVSTSSIRTKGTSVQVDQKLYIPLIKGAQEGPVTFQFTLTNVEGGRATAEESIEVQRPVFDKLYLRMADGSVLEMFPDPQNSNVFMTDSGTYSSSLMAKVLSKPDFSGFTWVAGEGGVALGDEFSPYISLNDPTVIPHHIVFDALNFRLYFAGEQLPSVKIAGVTLLPGADGLFRGSVSLTKGQQITFEGISNPSEAIDPDFFKLSGQDILFDADNGTYVLAYDKNKNFILVEQENVEFPDALWVTGEGMGKPVGMAQTTSWWGWDNPYQYFFCKKTGEKTFQVTLYLSGGNFKFFKEKGWGGGEFRLDTGFDYISPGFTPNGDGNYVQTSEPGVYRLIIELVNEGNYRFMAQKLN